METTRDRIIRAASTLLIESGSDAVTVRSVSAAAGVQTPALYRIFRDKQALLQAVAACGMRDYLADKNALAETDDPVADLARAWDLHVRFGLARPAFYLIAFGAPAESPAVATQQRSRTPDPRKGPPGPAPAGPGNAANGPTPGAGPRNAGNSSSPGTGPGSATNPHAPGAGLGGVTYGRSSGVGARYTASGRLPTVGSGGRRSGARVGGSAVGSGRRGLNRAAGGEPTIHDEAIAGLRRMVERIAAAGRLRTSVERAVQLVHAGGVGVVVSQLALPPEARDAGVPAAAWNAVRREIVFDDQLPAVIEPADLVKSHAGALRQALVTSVTSSLSRAERALLGEWLARIADHNAGAG